ncbi:MAG: hypothetical protein A2231_00755 [Candidatus Firestonebacteria bacterium RIFOXYA2_FULL_40_8]|nr:MAG: hypothetical protein A2231_00755 [Candidatus Firestonebacteria bacterium RIFOXYA2_FULL_40_8]
MNKLVFSWPNGKSGALTTSWDDGNIHDRRLVSIFNKYGIKGTWNLNSGFLDSKVKEGTRKKYLSSKEIKSLFKGHEVAVHTVTHPSLWRSSDSMILSEVVEDRKNLERLTGYPVRGMALPNGGPNDERVKNVLRAAGILHCRPTARGENFELPLDFMYWPVTCHQADDFFSLWEKFMNKSNPDKLFYLWGHSYEFPRDNNWERMEEFGKLTGKKGNIWYATNMEIYNYVTAWRSLSSSVEMTQVENRSGVTVWFKAAGELKKVGPGKILRL